MYMMGQRQDIGQDIGRAHGGQSRPDREGQDEQARADAQQGPLSPHQVAEFHAVAAAMQAILDGASADSVAQQLPPAQRAALEHLYTARNARDAETGGYVSAVARKSRLNQALRCLQPVLARARRPDFRGSQPIYEGLAARISGVRKEIGSAIQAQIMPMGRKKVDAETDPDPGDEATGDGAGDDNGAGAEGNPETRNARPNGAHEA